MADLSIVEVNLVNINSISEAWTRRLAELQQTLTGFDYLAASFVPMTWLATTYAFCASMAGWHQQDQYPVFRFEKVRFEASIPDPVTYPKEVDSAYFVNDTAVEQMFRFERQHSVVTELVFSRTKGITHSISAEASFSLLLFGSSLSFSSTFNYEEKQEIRTSVTRTYTVDNPVRVPPRSQVKVRAIEHVGTAEGTYSLVLMPYYTLEYMERFNLASPDVLQTPVPNFDPSVNQEGTIRALGATHLSVTYDQA